MPPRTQPLFSSRYALARCSPTLRNILALSSSGPAPIGHVHTGSRSYLLFASFLQLPGFSLPLMRADAMPVGAQLIGHAGRDGELCAVAHWMRQALR